MDYSEVLDLMTDRVESENSFYDKMEEVADISSLMLAIRKLSAKECLELIADLKDVAICSLSDTDRFIYEEEIHSLERSNK